MQKLVDILVPFGPFLRKAEQSSENKRLPILLLQVIPITFFIYWIFGFMPYVGTLIYFLFLVPTSALIHIKLQHIDSKHEQYGIYLWYFVVIVIGFGSLRGFIGHFFLSDTVANGIGWQTGSPFQLELAFYHLGVSIAALCSIWYKKEFLTSVIVVVSTFLYGAAYVHIRDMFLYGNYSPFNTGSVLIGDVLLPTVFLCVLHFYKKIENK